MHAISFTKGCYLGQEIVERIRAQGRVNKKLTRVVLPGTDVPAPGTKTTIDGADAEVTSAVLSPRPAKSSPWPTCAVGCDRCDGRALIAEPTRLSLADPLIGRIL